MLLLVLLCATAAISVTASGDRRCDDPDAVWHTGPSCTVLLVGHSSNTSGRHAVQEYLRSIEVIHERYVITQMHKKVAVKSNWVPILQV
jgi:hypothetical protein